MTIDKIFFYTISEKMAIVHLITLPPTIQISNQKHIVHIGHPNTEKVLSQKKEL